MKSRIEYARVVPDAIEALRALEKYVRAIIAINGWNRLAVSFRSVPGVYEPAKH